VLTVMAVALGPAVTVSEQAAAVTIAAQPAQPVAAIPAWLAWRPARITAAKTPSVLYRRARERRREHRLNRVDRNRSLAMELMEQHWYGSRQYRCLDRLWQKESGWRHTAGDPSSGAYGIPQALPGDKMARSGDDWQTNPRTQIRWGLGYIKERYRTPCRAWAHSRFFNWY
jgi:hypothetical protein